MRLLPSRGWLAVVLLSLFPLTVQAQLTGPSSSAPAYLVPSQSYVITTGILTVGDQISGYKLVGKGDGLGAYDNGNGTFTLLMNHELSTGEGAVHAHGANGAFVSKWVINKTTFAVTSGADLIQNVNLWNTGSSSFVPTANVSLARFCSADLALPTAFFNAASGLGTQERLFLNGEENGTEGRIFAHIASGANAGTSYQLPHLGRANWENAVANPRAQNQTIVVGTDDTSGGQLYVYLGNKQSTGTEVEKAGLVGGNLYGVKVATMATEANSPTPTLNQAFTLFNFGNVANTTGATLQTNSSSNAITAFQRPEDGSWDPVNHNDFYFTTTASITTNSRLWRLRFNDITNPTTGGNLQLLLDGSEGHRMLDNLTVTSTGKVILQEDPGGDARQARVWSYDIASDQLTELALADPTRFLTGGANFLTTNEESSGVIDITDLINPGNGTRYLLGTVQAHFATGDSTTVEGGQLVLFQVQAVPEPTGLLAIGSLALATWAWRRRTGRTPLPTTCSVT